MNFDSVYIGSPSTFAATAIETELGIPFGGDLPQILTSDDDYYFVLSEESEPTGQVKVQCSGLAQNPSFVTVKAETSATRDDLSLFLLARNQVTNTDTQYALGTSTLADSMRTWKSASNVHQLVSAGGTAEIRLKWVPNQDLEAADGWSETIDFVNFEFYYH